MCNREEEGHRGSDKMLDMMIKMFHRELSDIKNDLPAFDATENCKPCDNILVLFPDQT